MATALAFAVAAGIGAAVRRWWALALPALVGLVGAVALSLSGQGLADTPIPFLVTITTAATAIGVWLRRRPSAPSR